MRKITLTQIKIVPCKGERISEEEVKKKVEESSRMLDAFRAGLQSKKRKGRNV